MLQIVFACGRVRPCFGLRYSRQQQRGEDRDNGDDDEKLDEGEGKQAGTRWAALLRGSLFGRRQDVEKFHGKSNL